HLARTPRDAMLCSTPHARGGTVTSPPLWTLEWPTTGAMLTPPDLHCIDGSHRVDEPEVNLARSSYRSTAWSCRARARAPGRYRRSRRVAGESRPVTSRPPYDSPMERSAHPLRWRWAEVAALASRHREAILPSGLADRGVRRDATENRVRRS